MRAAGGVWHTGGASEQRASKGYQLWIALPPEMEKHRARSAVFRGEHFQSQGPARVILGRHAPLPARSRRDYNQLPDVALKKGEKWRYQPPENHTVAWVAVHQGKLVRRRSRIRASSRVRRVECCPGIRSPCRYGIHPRRPSSIPTTSVGTYSVHTSREALNRGEARIRESRSGFGGRPSLGR